MSEQIPVKANTCRMCGKPGAIHTQNGVVRQRTYCAPHWSAYTTRRKLARNEQRVTARQQALDEQTPEGWVRIGENGKTGLPDGVRRLTLDHKRGKAVLRRGVYLRETALKHPEHWRELARFYLWTGWRLMSEHGGVLVLEKRVQAQVRS